MRPNTTSTADPLTPIVGGQTRRSRSRWTGKWQATVFIAAFALIGVGLLLRSFAASGVDTIFSVTTIPQTIDSGDGQAVEVGVKFESDVPGTITGVRFYKATTNTGTHVGNLWSSTGTLLASATFTNETASGWQQVNFATPVPIQANTAYVASYYAPNGHYSDDSNGLATEITTPPLHALANGQQGPDGVYAYGSSSHFPINGWQASNYYVDVTFTPQSSTTGGGTTTGPGASAGSITVDQQVATHESAPSTTISSPTFSTTKGNELLEVFLTSDGPSGGSSQSFKTVTGGGLAWTLKARSNTQAGDSEIWQAVAPSPLTNVQVTATRASGSYVGSMVVDAFIGASTTSGTTATNSAASGAPSVMLTTTRANSWVWAVGNDYDNTIARTVNAGQTKVDEFLSPTGDTYWAQSVTSTTPTAGTKVTVGDSAPTKDRYNMVAVELVPAESQTGTGGSTTPPPVATPPSVPTNLTATASSSTQIKLTWSVSIPANTTTITSYTIYRNGTDVGTSKTTSYTDTALTAGTTYTYRVSASASNSTTSGLSNSASASTPAQVAIPPSAPTGLKSTGTLTTSIGLSWTAVSGASSYNILRDNATIGTSTTTTYTDSTVSASTTYIYAVEAVSGQATSAPSSNLSVTTPKPPTPTPPSTPIGLTATAVSSTQVNLSWNASTGPNGVSGYDVYRNGSRIGTSTTTTYGDGTVAAGTTYSYTVSAYDGAGDTSAQSGGVSVKTPDTSAPSSQSTNCAPSADATMTNAVSHLCGFPDTTNSGVQAGVTLRSVPGQVSSGPGWTSDANGDVEVTGNGATLSDLFIPGDMDFSATNVTINNVQVMASGTFGVSFRHTSNDTLENSTISGTNSTSGRVNATVADVYEDSTGLTIKDNNIYWFRSAVQLNSGTVTGNYIHDPGYISGDHTNGVIANMGDPLTVSDNTIFNSQGQTDCVSIDDSQDSGVISNRTISGNLMAGGGYPIYGGYAFNNTTSNIVITNNHFSKIFYPKSGQFGTDAYYNNADPGNVWSGNVWDDTGATVAP